MNTNNAETFDPLGGVKDHEAVVIERLTDTGKGGLDKSQAMANEPVVIERLTNNMEQVA